MAIKTTIVDDFDGKTPAETLNFFHQGDKYAIDLGDENGQKLMDLLSKHADELKPYLEKAVKVGKASAPAKKVDATAVREWANANGYEVAPRGRISFEVLEAYENRNKRKAS